MAANYASPPVTGTKQQRCANAHPLLFLIQIRVEPLRPKGRMFAEKEQRIICYNGGKLRFDPGYRHQTKEERLKTLLRLLTKYVFKSAIVKTNKLRVFQGSLYTREPGML